MEAKISLIKEQITMNPEILAFAILNLENEIIFKSANWDVNQDIKGTISVWNSKEVKKFTSSGKEYILIQNTSERLIAVSFQKQKGKILSREYLIGIQYEQAKILSKIEQDVKLDLMVAKLTNLLKLFHPQERIKEKNGRSPRRIEKIYDLTPKILSDSSRIFEKLGLSSIGLNETDAKVYLALLRKGEDGEKVGNLNKELDLKRTHIYRIIDRLLEKGWVDKKIALAESAQFYVAHPLQAIIDKIIKEREDELKVLKGLKLIVKESPENGWHVISDADHELKTQFDINIYEIMGFEKDSGMVIFEYDRVIMDEENLDRVKLRLYIEKLKREIKTHPDIESIKVIEKDMFNFFGAEMILKFKSNSESVKALGVDTINIFKLVAIPIDNKIYVIWGSKEKFQLLYDLVIKIG